MGNSRQGSPVTQVSDASGPRMLPWERARDRLMAAGSFLIPVPLAVLVFRPDWRLGLAIFIMIGCVLWAIVIVKDIADGNHDIRHQVQVSFMVLALGQLVAVGNAQYLADEARRRADALSQRTAHQDSVRADHQKVYERQLATERYRQDEARLIRMQEVRDSLSVNALQVSIQEQVLDVEANQRWLAGELGLIERDSSLTLPLVDVSPDWWARLLTDQPARIVSDPKSMTTLTRLAGATARYQQVLRVRDEYLTLSDALPPDPFGPRFRHERTATYDRMLLSLSTIIESLTASQAREQGWHLQHWSN